MHLVTIDRLPVEVNVLCFWAVLGTAGGLNLALMGELLNRHKRHVDIARTVHPVFRRGVRVRTRTHAVARARDQEPQLRQAVLVDSIRPLVLANLY